MPGEGYYLPQRGLVSQMDSARIQNANITRSKFVNQWTRKTAFDAGKLIPILVDEVLPGDHMSYQITAYIRMATPLFPMFDEQRVDTHFFFVPNRIVWDNWVKMMGEQQSPGDSIAFTVPQVGTNPAGEPVGNLYDHMGIPTVGQLAAGGHSINALPFRMYNLIWNTWFRDENLSTASTQVKNDGPDTNNWYNILDRAKSHDYFTTALPWPQKFTAPTVPIGGTAPVIGIGKSNQAFPVANQAVFEANATNPTYAIAAGPIDLTANDSKFFVRGNHATTGYPQIFADLAATSGVAINTLRQAWMVQSLLERDARGGTRYVELVRSHFGVTIPDFRVQRPEYIGGGQSSLNITPIAQTAPTAGVPLGAIGGAGTSAGSHRASYASVEHGYIIGLISIKSELSYQQGFDKHWKRFTRLDFYWPELAELGEQAVFNYEIYASGAAADLLVFGYQERYQEYRTRQSDVTGIMRSTATGTLDAWHLAQRFLTLPALNNAFVLEDPPMVRILAAGALTAGQEYLANIMYNRVAVRPLPTYGTPAQMGRF